MAEEVAYSMVGKVAVSLFGVAKKEMSYMWNCSENVGKLRKEVEKLKGMKGRVQQQIDIANCKGDTLSYGVQTWVERAHFEISKAEEFLEEESTTKKTCFNVGLCVNPSNLHHYGKQAIEKASSIVQHQEDGNTFENCVSVLTPNPGRLDVYQKKNLDNLVTQNSALEDIITAIEDESIQIIGIYGLGGVGKTTLAMEVVTRVKNQFAVVAFTTVSQTVDVNKIQRDIVEAAKRIMKGEKILIVLDDVWEKLKLDEIGIPCGVDHMNCKILLTSRNEDVCVAMNAQSKICVHPLPIEEAWILFKRVVGERIEIDSNLKLVAMAVVEECGGLPLIIQAVGNALKNKSFDSWESALARLKKHAPLDIAPEIRKAYTHLKLSYDYLESEEAKSCFLLCGMFPEDARIRLERLTHYGVGLGRFDDLDSLEDARDRVRIAVNILKSSGLLLNENKTFTTKMHDVVRDVSLLIASKGKEKFLVKAAKGLEEWQPRNNSFESCYTGISLMKNKIHKFPDYEIHFPYLDILLIQENYNLSMISDEFFLGIKEARVLDMADNRISSLPQSFKQLTKLRMLNLGGNEFLREISVLGELEDLEILILNETGVEEIPKEIGQLTKLRRFEVNHCKHLSHISPGVISKLRWLEELCVGFYTMHEGIHATLVEVMNLSKLTYIDLFVPRFDVVPEGFSSVRLKGFVIQIGGGVYFSADRWVKNSKRYLILGTRNLTIPFLKWTKRLIEASPEIILRSIENLSNILPNLYYEGFDDLESLRLWECNSVSCLVDIEDWDQLQTSHSSKELGEVETKNKLFTKLKHLGLVWLSCLEVLWNCPDQYISFSNLITLEISFCDKLVRVFSMSVAQGLTNLQELRIGHSSALEEVISGGFEKTNTSETQIVKDAEIIVFPCLAKISLENLSKLKSFYSGDSTMRYPSLVEVNIKCCISMKAWGQRIHETPKLKFVGDVPLDGPCGINDAVAASYENDQDQYLGFPSS